MYLKYFATSFPCRVASSKDRARIEQGGIERLCNAGEPNDVPKLIQNLFGYS